jgi:hypothetical protein
MLSRDLSPTPDAGQKACKRLLPPPCLQQTEARLGQRCEVVLRFTTVQLQPCLVVSFTWFLGHDMHGDSHDMRA